MIEKILNAWFAKTAQKDFIDFFLILKEQSFVTKFVNYKTEVESQIQKISLRFPGDKGGQDKLGNQY